MPTVSLVIEAKFRNITEIKCIAKVDKREVAGNTPLMLKKKNGVV